MTTSDNIRPGTLLIARPFLGDDNFERSVVLVCEHNGEGTFGLVLNSLTTLHLSDVVEDVASDLPLHLGGPMQHDTLHFVHCRPDLIDNSIPLGEGLFWSGNFGQIKRALTLGTLPAEHIRFFVGYSGWGSGQLLEEINDRDSWILTRADSLFVLRTPADECWRSLLKRMGGEYKVLSNYPIDPRLN